MHKQRHHSHNPEHRTQRGWKIMEFIGGHGGRHRGRHGPGRFGGFGSDDGLASFRGRKLSARDLELLILALLAEQPLHGYRIIKELEERSKGFYVPSPGMIYPALALLEETDHVIAEAEGTKKLYRLTDQGRAHLDSNREQANAMLAGLATMGEQVERMRDFLRDENSDDLREIIHALRDTVRGKRHASPQEKQRVAAILKRATAEIRGN